MAKQEEVIDFKIHIPEFEAKLQPTQMMFNPAQYRERAMAMEQQIVSLSSAIQMLMAEVISNRRVITEMQNQLSVLAKSGSTTKSARNSGTKESNA